MVDYAVLPGRGEDSFAVQALPSGGFLCVADGCGGLGSRRYQALNDQTGAYAASRLLTRLLGDWAAERPALPQTPEEGRALLKALEGKLESRIQGFVREHRLNENAGRIVGSMQRLLPSTLCAALLESAAEGETGCFLWAGDSRGLTLDASGLHQYTRDDVRSPMDAFDRLSCDAPLSNCLSADQPVKLNLRRFKAPSPGLTLCATDGVFACLPTPMEFEMLLLSTMAAADSETAWQRKLLSALGKLANDDATLLCRQSGYESFTAMKAAFQPRLAALRADYILPVRGRSRAVARAHWERYRTDYDRTEGKQNERYDWRV